MQATLGSKALADIVNDALDGVVGGAECRCDGSGTWAARVVLGAPSDAPELTETDLETFQNMTQEGMQDLPAVDLFAGERISYDKQHVNDRWARANLALGTIDEVDYDGETVYVYASGNLDVGPWRRAYP